MRMIEGHKVNSANDKLDILATDQPGAGGANHCYDVVYNPDGGDGFIMPIRFQNGPINEAGVNGLTQEVLLTIVADRLECFQAGPYACIENAAALAHVKLALMELQSRTKARMARNVEGTHTV